MNSKTYKVLKEILSNPGEWRAIPNLAFMADMTIRQISSIICSYEYLPLVKERDDAANRSYVMFPGSPEEAEKAMRMVTEEYYNISEEMKERVFNSLSTVAWMSVSDVMDDTSFNRNDVSHTLNLLEGVTTKTSGVLVLYKRDPTEVN